MNKDTSISINLESLFELSVRLNTSNDVSFILNSAILSLMGKLKISRACVLTPVNNNSVFRLELSKGKHDIEEVPFFPVDNFRELNRVNEPEKTLLDSGFNYCFPLKYMDREMYVLCFGNKYYGKPLSKEEIHYANLVAVISANAMQIVNDRLSIINAKASLEQRNQLLKTLFEMSNDFSTLLSKKQILKMLSFHLMGQLMVSRFAVFLTDTESGFAPFINRFDKTPVIKDEKLLHGINKTIQLEEMPKINENIYFAKIDARVISPLKIQGSVKGFLVLGKKMNGENYTDDNLQFIEALGNTSIAALENERLFEQELEKKRLENELKLALEIQKNLLPKEIPVITDCDLAGTSLPSRHVGGDYYDFIKLDNKRLMIAIADVSGKGMPAALLMANVQAALRALAPLNLPLKELIYRINYIIYQNTSSDKFVTFFCSIFDCDKKELQYINAGHNPPLLFRQNGDFTELKEGGIILGFSDEAFPYSEGNISLLKNDIIIFYTDGVTEAQNDEGQEYGEENLKIVISKNAGKTANLISDDIIESVRTYTKGKSQHDDITLVVIKTGV